MSYKLTLSAEEHKTLDWLADRGYDAGLSDILRDFAVTLAFDKVDEHGVVEYTIPEHLIWEMHDSIVDDPNAWLACLNPESTLYVKLRHLEGSIV